MNRWLLALGALVLSGCPDGGVLDGGTPSFPADYASTYIEVRNCRSSGDHNLNRIRILTDPSGLEAYRSRDGGFPEGAVVLKVEHDFADTDCTGPVTQWTVMRRVADGGRPYEMDWEWQAVDKDRNVMVDTGAPCVVCHRTCGVPPDGYEGTCALP